MYTKSQKKLRIQNGTNETRAPPFWLSREIKESHLFVTNIGNGGGLGNKLFEFAGVFGVSKLNNRTPSLKRWTREELDKYFDSRVPVDNFARNTSSFLSLVEQECHTRMNETKKLPQKNVTIGKYLISRHYFADAEEELRKELMFKASVIDAARMFLSKSFLPPPKRTTFARVVIHVRRGDLLSVHEYIPGFVTFTSEYFSRSMTYYRQCYDRVDFVVMSDDIAWCKKNINGSDVVYSEGNSPGVDMAISSLCDHAIITLGTFSIWAAWFANGVTIRPLNMAKPNSTASAKFELEEETYPLGVVLI